MSTDSTSWYSRPLLAYNGSRSNAATKSLSVMTGPSLLLHSMPGVGVLPAGPPARPSCTRWLTHREPSLHRYCFLPSSPIQRYTRTSIGLHQHTRAPAAGLGNGLGSAAAGDSSATMSAGAAGSPGPPAVEDALPPDAGVFDAAGGAPVPFLVQELHLLLAPNADCAACCNGQHRGESQHGQRAAARPW